MAIDTTKPFTRNNWNEDIIQSVNDLCLGPEEGCDPIEVLEKVDPEHIWTKSDVTEVQDKLIEICPENTFGPMDTPQLWSYPDIIEPIETAIDRGWCGCEPDIITYDFGYFPLQTLEARVPVEAVKTWNAPCGLRTRTQLSPYYPLVDTEQAEDDLLLATLKSNILMAKSYYNSYCNQGFALEDEIVELEGEVATLEGEILGLEEDDIPIKEGQIAAAIANKEYFCTEDPGGSECESYTALVDLLEGELDDLEYELETKETELEDKESQLETKQNELIIKIAQREEQRLIWDTKAQEQWEILITYPTRFPTDITPGALFPVMSEPWGDYFEDTRNTTRPKWQFMADRWANGAWSITTNLFSPGGYPYATNFYRLKELENTCKWTTYTWEYVCCPFQIPPCEGSETWYYYDVIAGRGAFLGRTSCTEVLAERDWALWLELTPAVDYTRPEA